MSTDVLQFTIETEREEDGRWLAEITDLPGVIVYANTQEDAIAKVQALGLRVLADRIEHDEARPAWLKISFAASAV